MADLIRESKLNVELEKFIDEAEQQLIFFSPYFKLHDRLKDRLKLKRENYKLRIVIVFGKNEDDPSKSLSKDDFEFLRSFPYITIKYEKRLHAKYYANEREGMITSLNLHSYSQNNNIEVGVLFKTKGFLKNISDSALGGIVSMISDTENIATEADEFFNEVYANAELVFENEPEFESKFLGIQKKFIGSKILTDNSANFFKEVSKETPQKQSGNSNYYSNRVTTQPTNLSYVKPNQGFCIRTGSPLPFNPAKPLSYDSFQSWVQFENPDYPEKYCHGCGKSWKTSVRFPLCPDCQKQ